MSIRVIELGFLALIMFFPVTFTWAGDASPAGNDLMDTGRKYTAMFFERRNDELWPHFSDAMKEGLKSVENLKTFREQAEQQLGPETAVLEERMIPQGDVQTYKRVARFKNLPQLIEITMTFDTKGVVHGFLIRPEQKAVDSPHLEYKTKTELRLPFDGTWYVFWGGRTLEENYHAISVEQRFAYDILMIKDGISFTGDGKSNDQYYCFGQLLYAPGAGVVVEAVDGIADNKPGEMNGLQPLGNHVIIDHGNGEFSFIAHLKLGTVKVKKDQKVQIGDALGLCGNSGNSSEPHLHYHMQTTGKFQSGEGLPAQFRDYVADSQPVTIGEPKKGQSIERQPAKKP